MGIRRHIMPVLLAGCTLLLAFWIVASNRSARPFKPFNLTHDDLAGYCPAVEGATVQAVPMTVRDPAEPNIVMFGVSPADGGDTVTVRLVHGYNMPMCMKIKGYRVEEIRSGQAAGALPVQLWRVISETGETTIWATTMIRSDSFTPTADAVTSMAFPRVDVPDDPNWVPRGFTKDDLKHPIASLRLWIRARWNASRMDLLTFLRLRQPAWASEELLTYVSRNLRSVPPAQEPAVIRGVLATHVAVLGELQKWRQTSRHGVALPRE